MLNYFIDQYQHFYFMRRKKQKRGRTENSLVGVSFWFPFK